MFDTRKLVRKNENDIFKISQAIEKIKDKNIKYLETQIEALKKLTNSNADRVNELECEAEDSKLSERLAHVEERVSKVSERHNILYKDMTDIKKEMLENFDKIEFYDNEVRFNNIKERFEELEHKLDELNKMFKSWQPH